MAGLWVRAVTAAETGAEARAEFQVRAERLGAGLLLTTCHRVELYGVGDAPPLAAPIELSGDAAVTRLFRVTAGLDSAVIGEDEILHQVRQAMAAATVLDPALHRLAQDAIATGRQVRSSRRSPKSGLADRAMAWLAERAPLAGRPVLVVGAGAMGRALVAAAERASAEVVVASRGTGIGLDAAAERAPSVAAVAVALAGPWDALAAAGGPLPPIADLSSPPAVPAAVRGRLNGTLLGIDQLFRQEPVDAAWLEKAERSVDEGVTAHLEWLRGRDGVELMRRLRTRSEERRRARVERLLRRLPALDERQREAIEMLSRQLVNDLLHEPMVALRGDEDGSGRAAARRLFEL
jgi:glutamyl-tRNA reductase